MLCVLSVMRSMYCVLFIVCCVWCACVWLYDVIWRCLLVVGCCRRRVCLPFRVVTGWCVLSLVVVVIVCWLLSDTGAGDVGVVIVVCGSGCVVCDVDVRRCCSLFVDVCVVLCDVECARCGIVAVGAVVW